jgi:hypothetical protein
MLKRLIKILFFLSTFQIVTNAQWSFGGGYSNISNQVFWSHGASVQLEYNTPIRFGHTTIAFGGVYSIYFNSGSLPSLATPAVLGFRREFSVEPYQIVDILAKAEHHFSDTDFHLYASIGLGISYHSVSPVKMREWFDYSEEVFPSFNNYQPSQHAFEPSYQLAIGYNIPLSSNYSIGPELCYCHSLLTIVVCYSLNVNIHFNQ